MTIVSGIDVLSGGIPMEPGAGGSILSTRAVDELTILLLLFGNVR